MRLDAALVERLRTFCRDQAGKPLYATVNGIVAQAVTSELDRLERGLAPDKDPGPPADADEEPSLRTSRRIGLNTHHRR